MLAHGEISTYGDAATLHANPDLVLNSYPGEQAVGESRDTPRKA